MASRKTAVKAAGAEVREYALRRSPSVEVRIDGARYQIRPGQLGIHSRAIRVADAARALAEAAEGDVADRIDALEAEVRGLVALAFGAGSVDGILGPEGEFDVARALDAVNVVLAEASGADALAAVKAELAGEAASVAVMGD